MNDNLIKSVFDFIEEQGLQEELLNYVASCDKIEAKNMFER